MNQLLLNKNELPLLREMLTKYKQGYISGLIPGSNITFSPSGCRNKIISSTGGGGGGGGTWGSITGILSNQTDLQTALDGKVDENATITGATKTKITYDSKGLVTVGADATTADIAASTDKNYVTDAQLVVIGNTSGANSGNETASTIGSLLNGASAATPNDTDLVATVESSVLKKITWTNVKAFFKTYFDTLYPSGSGTSTGTNTGDNATNSQYSGLAASKQDTLVSGTNIKTINSNSLLGSGDLVITAGDGNDDFMLVASFKSLYNY